MNSHECKQLDRIFHPRGFAVFGGMGTPGSFGHLIALSQIRYGYQGNLYPISSKGGEIAGVPVYISLEEIKAPVGLASISVPARAVPDVLRECRRHGVAGVQIHSSGFAELGTPKAANLQESVMPWLFIIEKKMELKAGSFPVFKIDLPNSTYHHTQEIEHHEYDKTCFHSS